MLIHITKVKVTPYQAEAESKQTVKEFNWVVKLHSFYIMNYDLYTILKLLSSDAEKNSSDDTLQFRLKIKCTRNNVDNDTTDPKILYKNHKGKYTSRYILLIDTFFLFQYKIMF